VNTEARCAAVDRFELSDDFHLRARKSDLLLRLAQGGFEERCIARLTLAARQAELAAMETS
jgi:hypothetical protein